MKRTNRRKTLYLDARTAAVRPDGPALRISQPQQADRHIPLRRIDRAVVSGIDEPLFAACLAIVAQDGVVHVQDDAGRIVALLQPVRCQVPAWARELALLIEQASGLGHYHWWQDAQQRHAWSLVFRRGFRGGFDVNRTRLLRYATRNTQGHVVRREAQFLDHQLKAWLQGALQRGGLQPVTAALMNKGGDLTDVLHRCLSITLLWRYVRWRRQRDAQPCAAELIQLFELQAAAQLRDQFERHIAALGAEFHLAARQRAESS